MRTIKRESFELNNLKMSKLTELCKAYAHEKNHFIDVLKEWRFQELLDSPRKIRDEYVKKEYKSPYELQARHWKLALQDAAEIWDKYWQAIFVEVRSIIASKNMSEEERHYANYLLAYYPQFAGMMQGKVPDAPFEISENSRQTVAKYVQRTVKDIKGNNPTVKKETSVKFDPDCYNTFEKKGTHYIKLMTLKPKERVSIPLLGEGEIKGNITVVLREKDIEVHISNELGEVKPLQGPIEAVDLGYSEVMTDTSGELYGTGLGKILTEASDNLNEKMKKRNKLFALEKKYTKSKPKKAENIRRHNLGRKKQKNRQRKVKASVKKEINTSINKLVKEKRPGILITENLSHSFTHNKTKSVNRRLSSWTRGVIKDRIEFKGKTKGFRHQYVNPAYGSQTCYSCGFVDRENRNGDKFMCLHCGHEGMADQIAALNYLGRYGDKEIGLYMPHSQVKIILLERFCRRLECPGLSW